MSTNQNPQFALDVAFSSATTPLDPTQPMFAIGYGFSQLPPGTHWQGDGQKAQKVLPGSQFYFAAFDIANGAQPVTQIEVRFKRGPKSTPFVNAQNPIVLKQSNLFTQHGHSAGCNVVGTMWLSNPYTVEYVGADPTTFECVVIVTVKNGNSFQIDPEIVVEGGGVKPKKAKRSR
ncbi:MAG: hypothetical protein ACRD9S_02060 [Pyrinomonadaceae bacterium]